jgi:nicotinate-nucleotide--dimethylbenzimidazole phosphoribosyltransferase
MFAISIDPVSREAARAARERIDNLTKPVGSLGRLEDLAERLAAIAGGTPPSNYERRAILVGAGDHGVTAEGVSAYPSEVTPQMVGAFLAGFAAINALGRAARAEVYVADFGIATALPDHPRLLQHAVARGTRNFAREAAMTPDQVDAALAAGVAAFETVLAQTGCELLALGDMGIGNTTSAAAIICALLDVEPEDIAGRGTGVDDAGFARKIRAIRAGVARTHTADWRSVASEVGGFEILGLAGALLGAAKARVPVVLDGFIVSAAALLAQRIAPESIEYCIASHRSRERGHEIALRGLGLVPLFDLDLRLGEASGAALAMPVVEAAARMIREMKTFAEAGVATAADPAHT